MEHILTWITFFPLFGVVAIALTPGKQETLIKTIAAVALGVPLVLALVLLGQFDMAQPGIQTASHEAVNWIDSLHVQYHMGVDGLSILMVVLSAMLSFLCVFASWNVKKMVKGYFIMFLLLATGAMGLFCALDLFLFYVFFELMLLPMYFLIGIWGGEKKEYAAIKFFLYTMVGSVLILVAMLGLYFYSAGLTPDKLSTFNILELSKIDWSQQSMSVFGLTLPFGDTMWWLFFLGFAIKVPLFPFHTWLPWAHVQAPTAVSVILAGVLLKIGTYGMLRMNFGIFPESTRHFAYVMAIMGIVNIIYGAFCALAQKDLKKMVAYSSISHMGYVLLGMAVFTPAAMNGALLQMFNHGLSAAMMFMLVGVLYDRLHHRYIVTPDGRLGFGGIAQKAPMITAVWTVAVFASLGLPGLNGFISETMIFVGSFQRYQAETIVACLGIVLGAAYLLWMMQRVFLGPFTTLHKDVETGTLHAAHAIPEVTAREWIVLAPLAILCVWVGVFPQPFLNFIRGTMDAMVHTFNK